MKTKKHRLTDPMVNDSDSKQKATPKIQSRKVIESSRETNTTDSDPRARMEKRLIKYISKQSGIDSTEILRRAERKVKALRYCTMWLALCLISREQDLEMNSIIDSFSSR